MLLGFISSLQLYTWGQLTLAKDQNLSLIKIELGGEKKTKIEILPLLPFLFMLGSTPSPYPQLFHLCYLTCITAEKDGYSEGLSLQILISLL